MTRARVESLEVLQSGERVYLRHPVRKDAKEFLAMVRASRRLHRPWAYPPDTKGLFYSYVERATSERFFGGGRVPAFW